MRPISLLLALMIPSVGHATLHTLAFRATLTTEFLNFSDVTSQGLLPLRAGDVVVGRFRYNDGVGGNVAPNNRSINYANPIGDSRLSVLRNDLEVATLSQRAVFFANGNRADESQINVLDNDPVGRRDSLTVTVGGGDPDSGSVVDFMPDAGDVWRTDWFLSFREPCSSGSVATGNCVSNDPGLDLFAGVAQPPNLLRAIDLGGARSFSIALSYRNNDFADLSGVVNSVALVPEPATWTMLLLGFGLSGAALRRQRLAPG